MPISKERDFDTRGSPCGEDTHHSVIGGEECDATERKPERTPEGEIRTVGGQLEEECAQHCDERAGTEEQSHEGLEDDEQSEHREPDQLPEDRDDHARDPRESVGLGRFWDGIHVNLRAGVLDVASLRRGERIFERSCA